MRGGGKKVNSNENVPLLGGRGKGRSGVNEFEKERGGWRGMSQLKKENPDSIN